MSFCITANIDPALYSPLQLHGKVCHHILIYQLFVALPVIDKLCIRITDHLLQLFCTVAGIQKHRNRANFAQGQKYNDPVWGIRAPDGNVRTFFYSAGKHSSHHIITERVKISPGILLLICLQRNAVRAFPDPASETFRNGLFNQSHNKQLLCSRILLPQKKRGFHAALFLTYLSTSFFC